MHNRSWVLLGLPLAADFFDHLHAARNGGGRRPAVAAVLAGVATAWAIQRSASTLVVLALAWLGVPAQSWVLATAVQAVLACGFTVAHERVDPRRRFRR